jgi:hyperosmotically inducible periplasmic protein
MLNRFRKYSLGIASMIILLGFAGTGTASTPAGSCAQPLSLSEQVRLELRKVPFLDVFDNIGFTMEGNDTVVLTGQVVLPVLKSGAEIAMRRLPGIAKVENNIEVLPVSRNDDAIRSRTYRAVYSNVGFEKYAIQSQLPIRIIVKNGNVTLEGVVGNRMDKNMAVLAANSVSGVFSVTDNLKVG